MTMFADAGSDISWAAVIMSALALLGQLVREKWQYDRDRKVMQLEADLKSESEKAKDCHEERAVVKSALDALQARHDQTEILCMQQQAEINRLNVVNNLPVSTPLPIEPKPPGAPGSQRRPEPA